MSVSRKTWAPCTTNHKILRFVRSRVAASKFVVYGEDFTESEVGMPKSFNKDKSQHVTNIMNCIGLAILVNNSEDSSLING